MVAVPVLPAGPLPRPKTMENNDGQAPESCIICVVPCHCSAALGLGPHWGFASAPCWLYWAQLHSPLFNTSSKFKNPDLRAQSLYTAIRRDGFVRQPCSGCPQLGWGSAELSVCSSGIKTVPTGNSHREFLFLTPTGNSVLQEQDQGGSNLPELNQPGGCLFSQSQLCWP